LILLAGLGSTHRIWGELPQLLGRTFLVVCPDNRGVGGSHGGEPFTLHGAVDELVSVLDHLGIERAPILGASMGGLIAVSAALDIPARVDRLVLASCAAHLSRHGRRSLALLARLIEVLAPEEIGPALMTLAFAPPFQERFPGFVSEAAALYGLAPADVDGTLHQARHLLKGWDLRPRLAEVHAPTLVLAGARDAVVAVEDTATLEKLIPGAKLVTVPDAGHSVLAEAGQELLATVTSFLTLKPGPPPLV